MFNQTFDMTKYARLIWFFAALLCCSFSASSATYYSFTNAFINGTNGLTFTNPVCIASAPGETNRLFIVERKGRIVAITNLAAPNRTMFMDISARVTNAVDSSTSGEEGP